MSKVDIKKIDQAYANLVGQVFLKIFQNIESSTTSLNLAGKKNKWLRDILRFCEEEAFWFDCAEEYLQIDQGKLKQSIKIKAEKKLGL